MSDLGQDKAGLRLKLLELEHTMEQTRLARKSIELDRARIDYRLGQYKKSLAEIDVKLIEHQRNHDSISAAISKLKDEDD